MQTLYTPASVHARLRENLVSLLEQKGQCFTHVLSTLGVYDTYVVTAH